MGEFFSANTDVLIYGCQVATGVEGESFVKQISQFTGADVAASDDLMGAEKLGGDGDLEYSTGSIETNTLNITNYQGLLLDNYTIQDLYTAWQDGTPENFSLGTELQLNLNNNTVITATLNVTSTDANKLVLNATGLNAFVGYGANTTDINDDVGLALNSADLSFTLNANQTFNYSINNANVTVTGIDFLNISTKINATGDQNGLNIDLNNFNLNLNNVANINGNLQLKVDATSVTMTGTNVNVNAFVGTNNIGVSLTEGILGLKLYENNTYALKVGGIGALVGVNGLTLDGNLNLKVNTTGQAVDKNIVLDNS